MQRAEYFTRMFSRWQYESVFQLQAPLRLFVKKQAYAHNCSAIHSET